MKIAEHVAKAKRFEDTIQKLDVQADYEIINWARMHVCTHLLNGALHARGVTPENWDIRHTWYLEQHPDPAHLYKKLDSECREALKVLTIFEGLRQTHVRGEGPFGPEVTLLAEKALNQIKEFCHRIVSSPSQ